MVPSQPARNPNGNAGAPLGEAISPVALEPTQVLMIEQAGIAVTGD
jgi:hypothetical protein